MDYVEGDLIHLNVGNINAPYDYTITVGKVKRGKKNLLSIETNLYELKHLKKTIGVFLKEDIDDIIKLYNGKLVKPVTLNLVNDRTNWYF